MPSAPDILPYCGPAPVPATVWTDWNFDPWVIGALAVLALAFLRLTPAREPRQKGAFWIAMALLVVAFVSPLCALTVALFSARVFHHIILVALAAPLLAFALRPRRGGHVLVPLSALFVLHTLILWIWHAPAPYAFALSSDAAYWAMESSLLLSAILLWGAILRPGAAEGTVLAVLLGSVVQMGMLGALLTFAAWPLLPAHATTTAAFGLTPVEDQQLAGLLMWVPASVPYVLVALHRVFAFLTPDPASGGRASPE